VGRGLLVLLLRLLLLGGLLLLLLVLLHLTRHRPRWTLALVVVAPTEHASI